MKTIVEAQKTPSAPADINSVPITSRDTVSTYENMRYGVRTASPIYKTLAGLNSGALISHTEDETLPAFLARGKSHFAKRRGKVMTSD